MLPLTEVGIIFKVQLTQHSTKYQPVFQSCLPFTLIFHNLLLPQHSMILAKQTDYSSKGATPHASAFPLLFAGFLTPHAGPVTAPYRHLLPLFTTRSHAHPSASRVSSTFSLQRSVWVLPDEFMNVSPPKILKAQESRGY